jgi:hypothetical protein
MEDTKPPASMAASSSSSQKRTPVVTMIAKYGKQKFELSCLPSTSTNVGHVKEMLHEKTGILPKRQKLIGLKRGIGSSSATLDDYTMLSELNVKGGAAAESSAIVVHQFILMGAYSSNPWCLSLDPSFVQLVLVHANALTPCSLPPPIVMSCRHPRGSNLRRSLRKGGLAVYHRRL